MGSGLSGSAYDDFLPERVSQNTLALLKDTIQELAAERDALRGFVERVSWLDPSRGPIDAHALVADAKRLVGRE